LEAVPDQAGDRFPTPCDPARQESSPAT